MIATLSILIHDVNPLEYRMVGPENTGIKQIQNCSINEDREEDGQRACI